jgi:ATP-binding cassette subfamily B protein
VEDIDEELGERGSGLSEGQMQRLAIARALYADAPILLLDESTSALDEETEQRLLENLRSMTDKTVIFVTHRKAALSICDRVLEFTETGVTER